MTVATDIKHFEHFKYLLEAAKKYKKPSREKTLFDTAIRNHYENPTTELLEFFLNPLESHELGDVFWKGFSDALQKQISEVELNLGSIENLERECATENSKRIDLCIETDTHLILIEAKINHSQKNPFDEYIQYAQSKIQHNDKQILGVVLCISGKSDAPEWIGLSYQQIVECIRPFLAAKMLSNPMNKWNLFAREFLLHLESYYQIKNLDMNRLEFILENYKDIEDIQKVKTNTIKGLVENIGQYLNESIDDYESYNKFESWGGIRFYNQNWPSKTNCTLFFNSKERELKFELYTYILNMPEQYEKEVFELLKINTDPRFIDWGREKYARGAEKWLCLNWTIQNHNLDDFKELIVEKAKVLDYIERKLKNPSNN